MMFVEADAVEAQLVHFLPGVEMLGIGLRRDLRVEEFLRQRIGQLAIHLQ